MKSLRGKPRIIMLLGFNSFLSQQAAGNYTQERLKGVSYCLCSSESNTWLADTVTGVPGPNTPAAPAS